MQWTPETPNIIAPLVLIRAAERGESCWAEVQIPCIIRKICRFHGFGCLYKLQQSIGSGSLVVGAASVSLCGFLDLYLGLSDVLS